MTSPLDPFQGVAFAANHLIIRSPRLFPSFIEKLLTFSPFFKSNENPIQARREKINARMELLKELVPGCSKVCACPPCIFSPFTTPFPFIFIYLFLCLSISHPQFQYRDGSLNRVA